jgi:hypothetical protein
MQGSAATAPANGHKRIATGLMSPPRYFFLGGVAILASEVADAASFGFSFFGFLVSRLLRT